MAKHKSKDLKVPHIIYHTIMRSHVRGNIKSLRVRIDLSDNSVYYEVNTNRAFFATPYFRNAMAAYDDENL